MLSVDAVEQIFDVVVSYLNFTSSLFATPLLVTSTGLLTLPNYGRGMFCVDFRVFCPNIPYWKNNLAEPVAACLHRFRQGLINSKTRGDVTRLQSDIALSANPSGSQEYEL